MKTDWPFDQPENCAVISVRRVMLEGGQVLLVVHDEEDHGWQFLPGRQVGMDDVMVVLFKNVVAKDPTLFELADLPPGWQASRKRQGALWLRERIQREERGHEV
jgi:hypothetical protein